jgi:hypothetical protein
MAAHPVVCCGVAPVEVGRNETMDDFEEVAEFEDEGLAVKALRVARMFPVGDDWAAMAPAARVTWSKALMEGILTLGNENE